MKLYHSITIALLVFFSLNVKGQIITTFAGNGMAGGPVGDGGPATGAVINAANGGAFDKYGNYYVAEILGNRIRKIDPTGIITTVAGIGSSGFSGDSGQATAAKLNESSSVLVDSFGNLYINDIHNYRIRKVDAATGIITTIAGTGVSGFNGDNIPATDAQLGVIEDICIDKYGNLYLSDYYNNRVRKINTVGIISTIAGYGGFSSTGTGDGGSATLATFNWISGITTDDTGNIYIADANAAKIRKINTSGIINTIAGNGSYIYIGDNIPATSAQMNPIRLAFDKTGHLTIGDSYNRRVLQIDDAGIIHSIAGNGSSGFGGDNGPASAASLDFPAGIVYDSCGNLYIAESTNRRVRKVTYNPECWPVAVKDVKTENLSIFPTPATEEVHITGIKEAATYILYEMTGRAVMSGALLPKENEINISNLAIGMYLLQVEYKSGEREIRKIVKE